MESKNEVKTDIISKEFIESLGFKYDEYFNWFILDENDYYKIILTNGYKHNTLNIEIQFYDIYCKSIYGKKVPSMPHHVKGTYTFENQNEFLLLLKMLNIKHNGK